MAALELHATRCAICGTGGNATERYPANFTPDAFSPEVFSARRLPDRIHYRMVTCNTCGLVRSDPVVPPEVLAALYAKSTFDYGGEVEGLKRTYGGYLARLTRYAPHRHALLEVGCGNGFFLQEALNHGYSTVRGVEPGRETVAQAPDDIREHIVCDVMRPDLFPADHFDVVCLFQVFDHIPDPAGLLAECRRVLKPGGLLLILNHNIEAWSARLLGERSPIIDIEHTFLYSPATLSKLVTQSGFVPCETGSVWNHYSLGYVVRLVPLPGVIKRAALSLLRATALGRLPVAVPLGNLYLIAQKPAQP